MTSRRIDSSHRQQLRQVFGDNDSRRQSGRAFSGVSWGLSCGASCPQAATGARRIHIMSNRVGLGGAMDQRRQAAEERSPTPFSLFRCRFRLRAYLEAAPQGQMDVDALHALLRLYADQGRLRGIQRQLALRHESQIRAANLVLRLDDLEGAPAVGQGLGENLLAFSRGNLGGECVFDLAKCAQPHGGVRGDGLFLLSGPNLDLRLERTAPEDGHQQVGAEVPDRVAAILEHEEVARDRADAGGIVCLA